MLLDSKSIPTMNEQAIFPCSFRNNMSASPSEAQHEMVRQADLTAKIGPIPVLYITAIWCWSSYQMDAILFPHVHSCSCSYTRTPTFAETSSSWFGSSWIHHFSWNKYAILNVKSVVMVITELFGCWTSIPKVVCLFPGEDGSIIEVDSSWASQGEKK